MVSRLTFLKGVFVADKPGAKIFAFVNAMIFAFMTKTKHPLIEKNASK